MRSMIVSLKTRTDPVAAIPFTLPACRMGLAMPALPGGAILQ